MSDDPLFFSDDNKNNNNSNNDIDIDLMAAMNAALDDESEGGLGLVYGSEADTESLLSIDVMGEAMNLLSSSDTASATGSGSVEEEEEEATMTTTTATAGDLDGKEISIDTACDTGGAGDAPQDGEEQIDFDDFMAGKATIDDGEDDDDDDDGEGNKRGEVDPKAPDESADAENDSGPTTANGTAASSYSPATTASITDDDDDDEKEPPREQPERQPETTASVSVSVPLQQFENALALIQDLEHRVLVLETDRQRLVEDNTVLREETLRQATEISTLQAKLAEFPKLLEETVDEEAKLAAAKAEAETKFSFWKKDMDRQEKESEEEKRKRNRKNAATTDSLKQEDFLKGIVELKEQEEQSAAASSGGLGVVVGVGELLSKVGGSASAQQPHSQPPADGPHSELADANDNDNNNDDNNETNNNNQQPRRGRFSFLRGWGGRNNNKDKEKDENNNKEHKDNDQNNEENEDGEDTSDETDGVGVGAPESSGPADISAIATTKSSGGGDEGELLRISRSHDSSGSAGDGPLDTGGEDYGSNDLTNVVVYDPQNPDEKMLGLLM
eukprot:jgi/Psemu1/36658/gm1.36658_g